MSIKWTDTEKPQNEDDITDEKSQLLKEAQDHEAKDEEAQDHKEDSAQNNQNEEAHSSISTVIVMLHNFISKNMRDKSKRLRPITDNEYEYLKKHSARFDNKYAAKVNVISSPEVEFLVALLNVEAAKIYDYYSDNDVDFKVKPDNEVAPDVKSEAAPETKEDKTEVV